MNRCDPYLNGIERNLQVRVTSFAGSPRGQTVIGADETFGLCVGSGSRGCPAFLFCRAWSCGSTAFFIAYRYCHPERPKKITDFRRESKDLRTDLTAYVPSMRRLRLAKSRPFGRLLACTRLRAQSSTPLTLRSE